MKAAMLRLVRVAWSRGKAPVVVAVEVRTRSWRTQMSEVRIWCDAGQGDCEEAAYVDFISELR